ncbi:MAG: hypothetical protein LBV42_04855 [Methanobrevibacter sp.]|jgi:hypothetical protein|nr:hypothetical protein [Methanobrevibacter sp.]
MINKERIIEILNGKSVSRTLFIVSFFIFLYFLIHSAGTHVLRYDEVFSLHLVKDNMQHIIKLTAIDVHPPLHYFWLKLVDTVCNALHVPGGKIFIGSVASAIPILILMIFSVTYLRKEIGNLFAALFCFSLVSMPHMIYYMLDVRMYSLGMLFLTLSYYVTYKIQKDEISWKNYLMLIILTLCGLFTQYYVGISIFCAYLMLLIWLILRNDLNRIKWLILSGIISAGIFIISWGPTLLNQIKYVSSSFWIGAFDITTILHALFYMLCNYKIGDTTYTLINSPIGWDSILLGLLIFTVIIMILAILFDKHHLSKSDEEDFYNLNVFNLLKLVRDKLLSCNFLIFGFTIFIFEIIIGMLLSNLIGKPTLHVRYLVVTIPVIWLSICIAIKQIRNHSKIFSTVIIIFLLVGAFVSLDYEYSMEYDSEMNSIVSPSRMIGTLKLIPNDDLIIDGDLTTTGIRELVKHHPDNATYVNKLDTYWEPPFLNIYASQHNMGTLRGDLIKRVKHALDTGHSVWIIGEYAPLYEIRDSSFGFLDHYQVTRIPYAFKISPLPFRK